MTHLTAKNRFSVDRVHLTIGGEKKFKLEEGCIYLTHEHNEPAPIRKDYGELIVIHPFNTDLNSIPWWMGWRLHRLTYSMPAIVHDYMLQHRNHFPDYTRKMIDRIYREALIDQGVGKTECNIRYAGVRIGSWWREERHD